MLRLLIDENFNQRILRGLRRDHQRRRVAGVAA
jgi:hypothetical protein